MLACLGLAATGTALAAPVTVFNTGFETDTAGWTANGGSTLARVSSGTGGITSADGAYHATISNGGGAFTRWGEYRMIFPAGGYTTRTKVYLNLAGGWANDVRFDWTVASNQTTNAHRRDFAFNAGFYAATDLTGPGAGTARFIISTSTNVGRGNSFPKNAARSPIVISASGWYTLEHVFQNNGGVLQVVLNVRDAGDIILGTWTLSDPSDLIGTTVGGNRYGWLTSNEFSTLAMDQAELVFADDATVLPVENVTRGWKHAAIQPAVDAAGAGDVILASAGTYVENISINKAVDVRGPNHNISPNGGVRLPEAVIRPAATNVSTGAVVTLSVSNALFRGFTVDGDNTTLPSSGTGLGGVYGTSIDAARGVFIGADGVTNITTSKNIISNVVNGVRLEQTTNYFASGAPAVFSTGIVVDDNLVQNTTGTGIRLGNSMYAKVTGNTVTNADTGIAFSSFRIRDTGSAANRVIEGNTVSARFAGLWVNIFHASPYALRNNTITVAPPAPSAPPRSAWFGIIYSTVSAPQNFTSQPNLPLVATPEYWTSVNNSINAAALEPGPTSYGYWLYHVDNNRDSLSVDHFGQITGGSVSNVAVGVLLKNRDTDPATNFGTAAVGAHAHLSSITLNLNAGGTGIRLMDDATWTSSNPAPLINKRDVKLTLGSGVIVNGGTTGLRIDQPSGVTYPQITGGNLSDLALSTQTGDYITLAGTTNNLDATSATFDTANGATASQSTLFDIEDKITHKLDDTALGLVRVKTTHVYVTATGSLYRGITAANDGDTVNVENGALLLTTEITKNVTFAGTFEINAANFPTDGTATTVLTSFLSRKGSSTATANLAGMNANQYAAVNANLAHFSSLSGSPVTIIRGMATVGYAPTIQTGVNLAIAGDVVRVSPGNYTENLTINKNITLESTGGRAVTTITGISGVGSLGAVVITGNTTAVTLGGDEKGFKVIGIDNGSPGLENATLYIQGGHTGLQIIENEIVANGDGGLLSEFGVPVSNWLIDGNIFSGQTFLGPNPADNGFANQFTTPNVPRQLVLIGNGGGNLGTATATNITFTNNVISGVAGGLNPSSQEQGNQLVTLDAASSTITGNTFQGTTTRFAGSLRVRRPGTTISGNTFSSTGLGANTSHLFVQNNTTALQDIVALNTFDRGAYIDNSTTVYVAIQASIGAASTGNTIHVLPGIYEADITLNKLVTVSGAGPATTTIIGQTGGDGATVRMAFAGATIEGFSITREGNNTTDWNDPALNSVGVAAQSVDGVIIRNNTISGNRNGIDINNCSGHTIRNNVVSNNRTGFIFRNQTDNLVVEENSVTGNWTVGVLFLDASGGSNVPVQSATGSVFFNNNISGNWYGQIVDRQSGGAIPAPGTNLKNFSGNWFGTTSPVAVNSNSAEPGYAAQIPVVFGGTAVPPMVAEPDVLGAASANFDITPLLNSGVDTDVETAPSRGTHGFQGNLGNLLISSALSQTGGIDRIYEAVQLAATGGTITVPPSVPLVLTTEITKNVTFSGSFAVGFTSIPTDSTATAVLTSFLTRKGLSTATADMAGMNAHQIAAINANLAHFSNISNTPVTIIRGMATVGYAPSIQAGVDFAIAGDVVRVAPGDYIENVTINKNLTLESSGGRDVTTITGISNVGSLGSVFVTNNTTAVTIGGDSKGFKIIGIENGIPGMENAALYFQGGHTGVQILDNELDANGEASLLSEFGVVVSGWLIDGNIFSGQTFVGPNPADNGTANQFITPNVPRQLVVMGNGGGTLGTATATNITFTNNIISGVAGGLNPANQEQGNHLVTLDVANSTITGNSFQGTSTRFSSSIRVRRPGTTISGNTFSSTGLGINTSHLFVQNNTTTLQDIVALNTFDKGTFVNGSTTVSVTIQNMVNSVTAGTTIRVLPANYVENVTINKNLTLESTGGRGLTTITGISNVGSLGSVLVTNNTTAVTIGGDDKGFKIIGIDNGAPGLENAALYFQGGHTGVQVLDNEIVANGEGGLLSEFGVTISNWLIDGNIFSGQTFLGPNPADNGFGSQFTTANVPRQLVLIGNGGGNLATATATNITFTNNIISGVAGGLNPSNQEQGNHLATLDVASSTITGNSFQGTSTRFASSIRVRRPGTTISGNTFSSTGLGINTSHLFVQNNTTTLQDIVAVNTFDKGAFVNGSTTVSVAIQNMVGGATSGSTVRVLPATYNESVTTSGNSVILAPALATSIIMLNGNLTLDANDGLAYDINGLVAGTDHDQWDITGTVTLGGAALNVIGSHVPAPNQSFLLIRNDLADPVSGTFGCLAEGGLVTLNGQALSISYLGGSDSNDVVLNYIPEIVIEQPNGTNRTDGDVIGIVDFPLTNVAATSTLSFTVRNTGTGPLTLGSISFDTAQFLDFSVDTPPPSVLSPGADATFAISFTPQASGERTTWMRIANGDSDENPFDIRLRGNATTVVVTEWDGTEPVIDTPGVFDATGLTFDVELGFVPTPEVPVTFIHADGGVIGNFHELPNGGVVAMAINGVIYYFQVEYTATDIFLTNFIPSTPPEWKWVSGPKARNGVGSYGTLNVAASTNNPGGRQGAMNWRSPDGSLWMFGGYGYATAVTNPPRYLNDLWQYRRDLGQWVWRGGNSTPNNFGVYGTQGVEAPGNAPGSRHSGTTWSDGNGNLWLFGGFGVGTGMGAAPLNDLWRYNLSSGQWTWMKGATVTGAPAVYGTQGTAGGTNTPGARSNSTGFYRDGALWLFGGYSGTSRFNDLWRYDIATGEWTWVEGSSTPNQNGVYGTLGTAAPANTPGCRNDATGWVALDGTLWLFGGLGLPATGTTAGDLDDLWRYDPVSGEWAWIKGSDTTGAAGVYGTAGTADPANLPGSRSAGSGWATVDGDLWLVGGFKNSNQSYDDVWIYDIASNQWTWKLGSAGLLNQAGVYGTQGTADAANKPGGRFTPSTWVTLNGTLWIFGGGGADGFGNTGRLSDLWSYGIPPRDGEPYDRHSPSAFPNELIVNEAPDASSATAGTMAYVPVSGHLSGSDADGDRVLFSPAGGTTLSQGTLSLNTDGTWTYTPAFGFTGMAAFHFKANDDYGGQSAVKTLVITVITNPADSDGDGIADIYEQSVWGSLAAADGNGDADLDGQTNYFEFLAGTNPLDGGERLATAPTVSGVGVGNGSVLLQLNHVRPGVNYHLETSGDLEAWDRVGTFTFSVSGSATVEDPTPTAGAPKFYRMSLEGTPAVILP